MNELQVSPTVILFVLAVILLLLMPEQIKLLTVAFTMTIVFALFLNNKPTTVIEKSSPKSNVKILGELTEDNSDDNASIQTITPVDMYAEMEKAQVAHAQPDPDVTSYEDSNVDQKMLPADEQRHWMQNEKYSTCYEQAPMSLQTCGTGSYLTFDEAHARLAALRQRDKRCIDGAIAKNANYYKKHFGRELDDAEAERWWGNDEY